MRGSEAKERHRTTDDRQRFTQHAIRNPQFATCNSHHASRITQTMAIGLLTLELYLPLTNSLKEKRGIVKPIIARLRRDFNVSVCEAEAQDMLSRAVLQVVCVSQNSTLAHRQLQLAARRVENWRLDAELVDYYIEMIE
jgi:uncharacterized protein